ncbi:MAG: Mut7-C ubiquitin [Deltaproteobacteria bacterium]|jgi:molybdopterin converting factor small subunit|nr:Mut7-C ubiquitin [Deltaproteobacteria bacterium]
MEIEVRLFATFRDYLPPGVDSFSFKRILAQETEVDRIAQELKLPDNIPKIFVVNGNVVTGEYVTRDGDVVSIFPPVAGG